MRRPGALLAAGRSGSPTVWLGANFWSRAGGPRMWSRYDAALVRAELQVLADHGLGMTRSFLYWPDAMPAPDRLDEQVMAHYEDFLDAHREAGLTTVPTFVVGHMSGQNWDPSWRAGRDLYGDVWLVARQAWYVRSVVERFAAHPAVDGWLISNEMPIYGREDAPSEQVLAWAELVLQAVRAGGGTQPVSLGDGAWGVEVTGHDNGFPVRGTGALVDWVGPHVYRMETDQVRQHLKAAFVCELAHVGGKPVVLEEFGLSTDFAGDVGAADYYRQTLHTSLLAGATGWVAWNNTDYDDLVAQAPYSHHPFEMHFGITDRHGAPKPPLHELQAFGRVLDAVDLGRCTRWDAETALVVSSFLEADWSFVEEADRHLVLAAVEQAHVAAREAGLPVAFEREVDGVRAGYRLYLVPSVKQLTGPGWQRLAELAAGGATVYASYATGDSPVQRGPWWHGYEELFGVRHGLRYGLVEPVDDAEVVLTVQQPFGDLQPGDTLRCRPSGGEHGRACWPVEATDGTVVATDAQGRPAIVAKHHGAGTAVLCTYPLEWFAAGLGRVNPEDTWRLYRALGVHAGVRPPVTVDDPQVLVDGLDRADGARFAWLVSQAAEPRTVVPRGDGRFTDLDGDPVTETTLPPYGVQVLQVHTGTPTDPTTSSHSAPPEGAPR